jgi:glycosyltransferase involved in cell wall biosynthesis
VNNLQDNKPQVSIILPALREPKLLTLIDDLELKLIDVNHEILIITSDKSRGESSPFIPFSPNIKYFKSYGDSLERAILLGFSVAQGSKIIVMDADGSHPTDLIFHILHLLETHEMIVASRFTQGGHYHTTFLRYLTSYLFTKYAQLLGSTISDPMSGYFGIQRQLLGRIRFKPYKWKTALEISNKLRPDTIELPFTFENRKDGKSKSNWKIGFKILWDIMEASL